jgi:squalene-hopene/tetraprenyl-beta-curcumene cyclase
MGAAPTVAPGTSEEAVTKALTAGAEALFARQRDDGTFVFDSSRAATLGTAGAATALHFADPRRSARLVERGADWLARTQNPDGGWAAVPGGSTETVPTAVAATTLQLLAPARHKEAAHRGRRRLAALGGVDAVADPVVAGLCRLFEALAGLRDERTLPRVPIEALLLPAVRRKRISFRSAPFAASALAQARRLCGCWRRCTNTRAVPVSSPPTRGPPGWCASASPVPPRHPGSCAPSPTGCGRP